jgi:hypothetical protein
MLITIKKVIHIGGRIPLPVRVAVAQVSLVLAYAVREVSQGFR